MEIGDMAGKEITGTISDVKMRILLASLKNVHFFFPDDMMKIVKTKKHQNVLLINGLLKTFRTVNMRPL